MKKTTFILVFVFQAIFCNGQTWPYETTPLDQTTPANFLLVWHEVEEKMFYKGDLASPVRLLVTKSEVFETLKNLLDFTNYENGIISYPDNNNAERRVIRIQPENIVGVWDLRNAQKIELTLKAENKRLQRQVVIEADEWEDNYYIIKN